MRHSPPAAANWTGAPITGSGPAVRELEQTHAYNWTGDIMKYRPFGKLDWEVSALGFGAMRLPVIGKDQSKIDEPEAIKMIRHAIDQGVNYVDTAYPYHMGTSEVVVGKALKDGYREKVKLATKMPVWFTQAYDDFNRFFTEQQERLQTEVIDFYLLHALGKDHWPRLKELKVLEWAEEMVAKGKIHHLGFSFHDDHDTFKEIVDAYDKWDFCQIQYNFMDIEFQAGEKGLKYAADKGLAVVVMEPLRGGTLTKGLPESVEALYDKASVKRSPADMALQWVWNQPEVSLVLSGMTAMQHVIENLASADKSGANSLDEEELALADRLREEYQRLSPIPCTSCEYCMPCESGVKIPRILEFYNDAVMYNAPGPSRFRYRSLPPDNQADKCVVCNDCVELCPQEIPIPEWLEKAHGFLGPKK